MTTPVTPIELVTRFCAEWATGDLDLILAYLADDAVYHNIPLAPVTGWAEIRATIEGFSAGVERIEFRLLAIAANGPMVLTERVDVFTFATHSIELPVMGAFEVADDHLTAWRDYFDLQQFMSQMTPPA